MGAEHEICTSKQSPSRHLRKIASCGIPDAVGGLSGKFGRPELAGRGRAALKSGLEVNPGSFDA